MGLTRLALSDCPSSCSFKGRCLRIQGKPSCVCDAGFIGNLCENEEVSSTAITEDDSTSIGFIIAFFVVLAVILILGFLLFRWINASPRRKTRKLRSDDRVQAMYFGDLEAQNEVSPNVDEQTKDETTTDNMSNSPRNSEKTMKNAKVVKDIEKKLVAIPTKRNIPKKIASFEGFDQSTCNKKSNIEDVGDAAPSALTIAEDVPKNGYKLTQGLDRFVVTDVKDGKIKLDEDKRSFTRNIPSSSTTFDVSAVPSNVSTISSNDKSSPQPSTISSLSGNPALENASQLVSSISKMGVALRTVKAKMDRIGKMKLFGEDTDAKCTDPIEKNESTSDSLRKTVSNEHDMAKMVGFHGSKVGKGGMANLEDTKC